MSHEEEVTLIGSIPKLSKIIAERGELKERDLSSVGLPCTTIIDFKTLIQRRTVCLTNGNVV